MLSFVVFLVIALTPLVASQDNNDFSSTSVSLDQFIVLKKLGNGAYAEVFLAKKVGGTDDGTLYALKAINVPYVVAREKIYNRNSINNERDILEITRNLPWAVGLYYAWREGKYLFLVMDLAPGGDILSRMNDNRNATVEQLILAEIVTAVEQLHGFGVLHRDLKSQNILIDRKGHLMLADFGIAIRLPHNDATKEDWAFLYKICNELFAKRILDENERLIMETFNATMTDDYLLELKNHPYFNGINWEEMSERKSVPPFQPSELEIDHKIRIINLRVRFKIDMNDQLDEITLKRLHNYTFVAQDHQNRSHD